MAIVTAVSGHRYTVGTTRYVLDVDGMVVVVGVIHVMPFRSAHPESSDTPREYHTCGLIRKRLIRGRGRRTNRQAAESAGPSPW